MRIAQVAPLWETVPPPGYGGVELVVSHLTDELVKRGHDVTLFASGDSTTLANLKSVAPEALRLDPSVREPIVYELLQIGQIIESAKEFDLIHFHTALIPLPFGELFDIPVVHTLHGNFNSDNSKLFNRYKDQGFISISDVQRQGGPGLNYLRTVYNGIDVEAYPFQEKPQDPPYLAFLGRMSPEKGPQHAITIAKKTGWKVKMAGKIDVVDKEFYAQEIAPHIDGDKIEYLGELSHEEKAELLRNAAATLFPITWSEPFGLVMIESMCAGTPIIGIKLGAVPEVIAHKKTGFICSTVEEIIEVIPEAIALDRRHCHEYVKEFFSIQAMVDGYEDAYRKLLGDKSVKNKAA